MVIITRTKKLAPPANVQELIMNGVYSFNGILKM